MEVAKARFVNCYLPQKWVSLTGTVSSHYGHSIFTWRCIYLRHVLLVLWRSQYTTNNAPPTRSGLAARGGARRLPRLRRDRAGGGRAVVILEVVILEVVVVVVVVEVEP